MPSELLVFIEDARKGKTNVEFNKRIRVYCYMLKSPYQQNSNAGFVTLTLEDLQTLAVGLASLSKAFVSCVTIHEQTGTNIYSKAK